jgi:hypothetical protein
MQNVFQRTIRAKTIKDNDKRTLVLFFLVETVNEGQQAILITVEYYKITVLYFMYSHVVFWFDTRKFSCSVITWNIRLWIYSTKPFYSELNTRSKKRDDFYEGTSRACVCLYIYIYLCVCIPTRYEIISLINHPHSIDKRNEGTRIDTRRGTWRNFEYERSLEKFIIVGNIVTGTEPADGFYSSSICCRTSD